MKQKPTRFKFTDHLNNVSYIIQNNGHWRCVLANGMGASFSYAVGHCPDEMALKFALQDAETDAERFEILQKAAPHSRVEIV